MISPRESRLRARSVRQAFLFLRQAVVPDAPVPNNNGVQHAAVRMNVAPENGNGDRIGEEMDQQDVRPPLEAENERLTRENQALRARIAQLEQAHGVVPGVEIVGEQGAAPRQARDRSTSAERRRAQRADQAYIDRMNELENALWWRERAQRQRNEMLRRRPEAAEQFNALHADYINAIRAAYADPALAEERVRQL